MHHYARLCIIVRSDDKPGSVVGSYLSRPTVASRLKRSTLPFGDCKSCYHMLLAADRVYLAERVTTPTGGLLHHPFTLTGQSPAVYSLLHLPSDYSGHLLDGAPSHLQPGLSSRSVCCQQLPVAPEADYTIFYC